MNTQQAEITVENQENYRRKQKSPLLWVLLPIVIFLFLLSSIILGSHLYKQATRDQLTVDLKVGELDGSIELFRIEYSNEAGEITVQGVNADNVVAPGTTVNYDIRLRNDDEVVINFVMIPQVEFLTGDEVPVEFRVVDGYGNYLLGDDNTWVKSDDMNALYHKGSIHPGEVFAYHVSWRWVFEVSEEQNSYDTLLGNQEGQILPGVRVGIVTESVASTVPVKSNAHIVHLLGKGLGCCWCCYMIWFLLLVCIVLLIFIWRQRRKLRKHKDMLDKYEILLAAHGIDVQIDE